MLFNLFQEWRGLGSSLDKRPENFKPPHWRPDGVSGSMNNSKVCFMVKHCTYGFIFAHLTGCIDTFMLIGTKIIGKPLGTFPILR